ncbi:hypothetical protein R1sor_021142 [Riccia sorocarpa]|uniref:Bromo domain-containing protein n=1 Tax=Riccia sorocarpa TaxID=122646 RepID=A0ABD3GHP9_9MARC
MRGSATRRRALLSYRAQCSPLRLRSRYLRPKNVTAQETLGRLSASRIAAKMQRPLLTGKSASSAEDPGSVSPASTNALRRSTRKRRMLGYDTDNTDGDDEDLRVNSFRRSKNSKAEVPAARDEDGSPTASEKKNGDGGKAPRREGLRPRQKLRSTRQDSSQEFEEDEPNSSTGNDGEDGGAGDEGEDGEDGEEEEDDEEEEEEEEEESAEREGRRRYALRNRTGVKRFSPRKEERAAGRGRSPRKLFQGTNGNGNNNGNGKRPREGRRSAARAYKRHRSMRNDDSDDSLLVDEIAADTGAVAPWARGARTAGVAPWTGVDAHASTGWAGNPTTSAWGHQSEPWNHTIAAAGAHTAGPSTKGGADIQPVQVDSSVGFDQIGGLSKYIDSLKEMVFFPLLYPQFFANYSITPPRGVLLCGPPGTGKTLVARALASAATRAGQKVNFYMRKGADVLSKWVGEAERQLKLLFEEAQRCQPSIIFFDEIDGLAPVRSSKQEQIHNSIVSTLLALMDGLDSRGQVVVIGATNRVDAIDGALRRPGRFDREFMFPLPNSDARAEILDIHTKKWQKPPEESLRKELAASCVGYCGADLRALCTEAAIRAFRKKYPQVYKSDDQFVIDVDSVEVGRREFWEAMSAITPAAHRGAVVHGRPLSVVVSPLLEGQLNRVLGRLEEVFPVAEAEKSDIDDSNEDESPEQLARMFGFQFGSSIPYVFKPRLLLWGHAGSGLEHLAPAVLHKLERFPVHSLGLPSLLSDPSAKSPEEALVHIFGEARRTTPSILFLPQLQLWWETAHDQLRAVLLMLLADLPSDLPVLLLGTCAGALDEIDSDAVTIFGTNVHEVVCPNIEERAAFFARMIDAVLAVSDEKASAVEKEKSLPDLPKAPRVERGPSEAELKEQADLEDHALRKLRMCFRDVCNRLLYEKRFSIFHYPVMEDDAPDYHTVVKKPMDVTTLLQGVDSGKYITRGAFLDDVDLIPTNAKIYNGDDYQGARIVSKACALRDAVHGMLAQLDPGLVAFCDAIEKRGGPLRPPVNVIEPPPPSPVAAPPALVTRASARLRGFQPPVPLEVSKPSEGRKSKRNSDCGATVQPGETAAGTAVQTEPATALEQPTKEGEEGAPGDGRVPIVCEQEMEESPVGSGNGDCPHNGSPSSDGKTESKEGHPSSAQDAETLNPVEDGQDETDLEALKDEDFRHRVENLKKKLADITDGFGVAQLEKIYACICRILQTRKASGDKYRRLVFLEEITSTDNFASSI